MEAEPLVVTTRGTATGRDAPPAGEAIENVHAGSVAVVSVDGGLVRWAGDAAHLTFTRSALKPLQALPFVREGGPAHFGWGSKEIAMTCASHSGEAMHVERVERMLATSGCEPAQLRCGCHVPGWYAALDREPPPGLALRAVEHNCSGKHAGFLAACRLHGEDPADYVDPDAPVQRRVAAAVADCADLPPHALVAGTDGCSAPNYALPLSRLALAFARLAQGTHARTEGESLGVLFDAMTRHPELVSGTARSDVDLMRHAPGDWVTKIGADGVQAIGVRSAGLGIALKVADGNRAAAMVATVEVLRQLGLLGDSIPEALVRWGPRMLRNAAGLATGRIVSRFTLRTV